MGIRQKILAATVGIAIASAGIASVVGYLQARSALREASFDRLTAVREMKASQIEGYFGTIRSQVLSLAQDPETKLAIQSFRLAFEDAELRRQLTEDEARRLAAYYDREFLKPLQEASQSQVTGSKFIPTDGTTRRLQLEFIADNPFETGSKHLMDRPGRNSAYAQAHASHHPFFRDFLERFGFYDIFLVEPDAGHIIYSVYKEVDFATSLHSGPYAASNFSAAYVSARSAASAGTATLVDFEAYEPSFNAFASFIATPVLEDRETLGVLVFQMPLDRINETMTSDGRWVDVGLGESGETYIVADDFTIRSESRFLIQDRENYLAMISNLGVPAAVVQAIASQNSAIGLQRVRTLAAKAALGGATGAEVIQDYRGVEVLSAYRPLEIDGVDWAILSEIDAAEAFSDANELRWRFLIGLAALVPVVVLVAFSIARSVTGPVSQLAAEADAIAQGDLDAPVDVTGSDEIGDLARRFDAMRGAVKQLVERQSRAIDALATPMIPFGSETLVLPLVGDLDERRMERIRKELADAIHESQITAVLIDMTGVPDVPDVVAIGLQRAVDAARLLGATVTITGLQATAAGTLAQSELSLVGIEAERTLEIGLRRLLEQRPQHL